MNQPTMSETMFLPPTGIPEESRMKLLLAADWLLRTSDRSRALGDLVLARDAMQHLADDYRRTGAIDGDQLCTMVHQLDAAVSKVLATEGTV
jgi:hypothetical protein